MGHPILGRASAHGAAAAFFLTRTRLLDVRQSTANIHEAAAIRRVRLATTMLVRREAGARRNQPADDDVLLESAQVVLEATHRSFGQHAGGLLEGGGGDERLGGK